MAAKKFEFRRVRDFGEIFGDIFLFMRLEAKPFFRSCLAICGVFMLLSAVLGGLVQSRYFALLTDTGLLSSNFSQKVQGFFSMTYFLTVLFTIIAYVSIQVAVFCYIKAYIDNGNNSPGIDQVWKLFARRFLPLLLCNILITLMTVVGVLFCFVPGIYLWVVLSPLSMIMIFEEVGFGEAFNRCFNLIKENFWTSLLVYFVSTIIYYMAGAIFGGFISIIGAVLGYFTLKSFATSLGVLSSFVSVFTLCFYLVPVMGIALNYFTLTEKKDGTGILQRINSIGEKTVKPDTSDEEY